MVSAYLVCRRPRPGARGRAGVTRLDFHSVLLDGLWMVSRPISGVLSTFLSEGWAAIHLSDLPRECLVSKACGPRAPTFDLAPGGVYQATVITHDAGALLPHRFTLTCTWSPRSSAVYSLWHCPARHRDSRFASTLPRGAPTFLTTRCRAVRPPSRLTIRVKSDTRTASRQGPRASPLGGSLASWFLTTIRATTPYSRWVSSTNC